MIIHLYEELGEELINLLRGQFAFVLWDKLRKKIFAARDKFGICPLYYSLNPYRFIFASEIKAISEDPNINLSLDPRGIAETALFYAPTPPTTCFRKIHRLPPAYTLTLNLDEWKVILKKYWFFSKLFRRTLSSKKQDVRLIKENLKIKLKNAIKNYSLHGDRPVALSISGGIDSSTVAYFASTSLPQIKKSFGIKFLEKNFDESDYQKILVRYLNLNHDEFVCSNELIMKTLPQVIWYTECPLFRTAPIPLFSFSKFIYQAGFNSVLSGEGADELLCGYPIFYEAKIVSILLNNQFTKSSLKRRLEQFLHRDISDSEFDHIKEKYIKPLDLFKEFPSHYTRWQNTKLLLNLFNKDYLPQNFVQTALKNLKLFLGNNKSMTSLEWAQYVEIITKQEGYILSTQGDRVFMAHAVEKRMPYLDEAVVSYVCQIQEDLKQRGKQDKYILRETMKGLLPKEIVNRPKQGYLAPNDTPFSKDVKKTYIGELMSSKSIKETGIFKEKEIEKIRNYIENENSSGNLNKFVQSAYVFILTTQVLHSQFIKKNRLNV